MSITIRDCLQLPSLSLGTVVAGRSGLDKIVNAISVVEFDHYIDDLNRENELLITAFYNIKDDVEAQCQAIVEYTKSGDVGIVLFYLDTILKNLDQRVLATADSLHFPIIVMPGANVGLRYSDVISDVMEAVFLDKKKKRANNHTMESPILAILESDLPLLKRICEKQNIDLQSKNTLCFIKINRKYPDPHLSTNPLDNLLTEIHSLYDKYNSRAIADTIEDCIVMLDSHSPDITRDAIIFDELFTLCTHRAPVQSITLFSKVNPASGCKELYKKYCDSISLAEKIYPCKKIFTSVEIDFAYKCYLLIHSLPDETNQYFNLLSPILDDRDEDLLLTLETYLLDADYEIKKTAEFLYLHRNTIQYRLAKIKKLMGFDINKLPGSYDIYLAVSLHRILGTIEF